MLFRHIRRTALALALVGLTTLATSTPALASLSVTLIGISPASSAVTAGPSPTNDTQAFNLTSGQFNSTGNGFGEVHFGSPTQMDMSTVSLSSSGAGTVTLVFSQNNLTSPVGVGSIFESITAQFLAGATGTFAFTTYGSQANTLYTTVPVVASPTVTSTGTVSTSGGSSTGAFTSVNPFSLTQVLTINFTSAGRVSFSSDSFAQFTTATPEPSTIALAVTGVPALGLFWLRRRRARA